MNRVVWSKGVKARLKENWEKVQGVAKEHYKFLTAESARKACVVRDMWKKAMKEAARAEVSGSCSIELRAPFLPMPEPHLPIQDSNPTDEGMVTTSEVVPSIPEFECAYWLRARKGALLASAAAADGWHHRLTYKA